MAGLFVIFILLDLLFTHTIKSKDYYRHKGQFVLNLSNRDVDYIVLGNSRAYHGLSTRLIDSAYLISGLNLGIEGANLADCKMVLEKFIEGNNNSKIVLLELSFEKLSTNSYSEFCMPEFIPYIDDDIIFNAIKQTTGVLSGCVLRYVPFSKFAMYNQHWKPELIVRSMISNLDYKGFDHWGNSPINRIMTNIPETREIDLNNTSYELLNDIFELASKNKMTLFLYSSPYLKYQVKLDYRLNDVRKHLMKIDSSYEDLSNSLHDMKYFADVNHVNILGMKYCSNEIGKRLREALNDN